VLIIASGVRCQRPGLARKAGYALEGVVPCLAGVIDGDVVAAMRLVDVNVALQVPRSSAPEKVTRRAHGAREAP
jgi:hypothetical protein